jgi:methionyl-tRNA formyltransferase
MTKNVVILGKGTLAIRVANWFLENPGYELLHVVPVMPEPTWTDSFREWALSQHVVAVDSGHFDDSLRLAEGHRIDLAISVFYDKIIKPHFISSCTRLLNLHNGPLPKYRGVSPINWALQNGESKHGVTIHEITPGIDDGPIVSQVEYSIYPAFDEVIDVYNRALEYGWVLFTQTMPILEQITPKPQDHAIATYYNAKQNALLGERRNFRRQNSKS